MFKTVMNQNIGVTYQGLPMGMGKLVCSMRLELEIAGIAKRWGDSHLLILFSTFQCHFYSEKVHYYYIFYLK